MTIADDPTIITETDLDTRPRDAWGELFSDNELMTWEEWWAEWNSNACCRDRNAWCSCEGSATLPEDISRLLYDPEEVF